MQFVIGTYYVSSLKVLALIFSMSNDLLCSWEFSFTNLSYVHSETKILKTVLVNQVLADISHQVWIFRKLGQKIKNSRACNITKLASSVDLKNILGLHTFCSF